MKKGLLLFVLALSISYVSLAQQKKPLTVKIQTPTAQCEECKQRIEEYLKYEEGVTKVVVYPRSKYTMVTYFADRTNIENIKAAIANVGYDADDVTADEDAYKKLPKTCKHPKK
ncbi:MAG: heavy-metal-associated domain-containing protein [Sphingobacteriales bacterium]|jgi:mercuric ion binding protein